MTIDDAARAAMRGVAMHPAAAMDAVADRCQYVGTMRVVIFHGRVAPSVLIGSLMERPQDEVVNDR